MKKTILFAIVIFSSVVSMAQTKQPAKPVAKTATPVKVNDKSVVVLKDAKDSASYSLGYRIAESLKSQGLQAVNLDALKNGMSALFASKSIIADSLIDNVIKKYQDKMSLEKMTINRQAGKAYMEANGKKPGVVTTASGLQYEILVAGTGTDKPKISVAK